MKTLRDDDQIADAVRRQPRTLHTHPRGKNELHAGQGGDARASVGDTLGRQVSSGKRTQRAVMHYIGIGDRQDHARDACTNQSSSKSCRNTILGRPKASVLAFMP